MLIPELPVLKKQNKKLCKILNDKKKSDPISVCLFVCLFGLLYVCLVCLSYWLCLCLLQFFVSRSLWHFSEYVLFISFIILSSNCYTGLTTEIVIKTNKLTIQWSKFSRKSYDMHSSCDRRVVLEVGTRAWRRLSNHYICCGRRRMWRRKRRRKRRRRRSI